MRQCGPHLARMHVCAIIIAIVVVAGVAEAKEIVLVDLPHYGHLGDVAEALMAELESRGVELLSPEEMTSAEASPTAIVTDDDQVTGEGTAEALAELVQEGIGLVLLVGRSRRHIEQANAFLKPRGIEIITDSQARGPVRWVANPLTAGLEPPPSGSLRLQIRADKLVPLARQNGRIVSAGMSLGEGGIVVIPTEIVTEGLQQRAPDRNGLRLVVRAASWAGRLEELTPISPTPVTPPSPELPRPAETQLPLERRHFAGAILYDCMACEDKWPEINAWVQDILSRTGLPVKALRVEQIQTPLVDALQSNPELVVLGTWREYSEAEIGAVHHYVAAGGRLLALAHAHTDRQIRLVYLNEILVQFGILVCLGRPGGIAEVVDTAITAEGQLGQMRGGARVIGRDVQPVVIIDDQIVAGIQIYQQGRVAVLDAGPLLSTSAYRDVLRDCLHWLMQG